MNIGVNVSFQIRVFSRYLPRSGISGSYGNSTFSFLRNLHTGLYSGCTSLHSHQQGRRIPLSLHPLQHLLFANFLNDSHIDQCEVTPPCSFDFSLIISDVEYIFMCLLTISMSSLDKHLFRSSAHFLIGLFVIELYKYLCILVIKPLSVASFANIFSQSISCLFILLMISFVQRNVLF